MCGIYTYIYIIIHVIPRHAVFNFTIVSQCFYDVMWQILLSEGGFCLSLRVIWWLYSNDYTKADSLLMRNHKISINPAILHLTRKYCVVRWRGYCFRFFYFFYQLHFASIRQLWLHIKMKQITWAMSQAGRAIRS